MENKYLEKIARISPLKAGLVLGSMGGVLGFDIGKMNPDTGKPLTTKERLTNAAILGGSLGSLGALHIHGKNLQDKAWKNFAEDFTRQHYYRSRGSNAANVSNLSTHFKEMGIPHTPKTKAEVHKFYKTQAMKHHPDRPTGSAKKMEELNVAYTKAKAHPEFEKLAHLNKYIGRLNDLF